MSIICLLPLTVSRLPLLRYQPGRLPKSGTVFPTRTRATTPFCTWRPVSFLFAPSRQPAAQPSPLSIILPRKSALAVCRGVWRAERREKKLLIQKKKKKEDSGSGNQSLQSHHSCFYPQPDNQKSAITAFFHSASTRCCPRCRCCCCCISQLSHLNAWRVFPPRSTSPPTSIICSIICSIISASSSSSHSPSPSPYSSYSSFPPSCSMSGAWVSAPSPHT